MNDFLIITMYWDYFENNSSLHSNDSKESYNNLLTNAQVVNLNLCVAVEEIFNNKNGREE